jgi:hypothetical protein
MDTQTVPKGFRYKLELTLMLPAAGAGGVSTYQGIVPGGDRDPIPTTSVIVSKAVDARAIAQPGQLVSCILWAF